MELFLSQLNINTIGIGGILIFLILYMTKKEAFRMRSDMQERKVYYDMIQNLSDTIELQRKYLADHTEAVKKFNINIVKAVNIFSRRLHEVEKKVCEDK